MIDLYYAPGPNPRKVAIMLEECGLPYRAIPVDLNRGDQLKPEFLKISPNNRIPAITDSEGPDGAPISIFESGAILLYLARKAGGRVLGETERDRIAVQEWLFWQVGGLGPMGGQHSHFVNFVQEGSEYAKARYAREYDRLLGVMDVRLAAREYLAGNYSIADMAAFPWLLPYKVFGVDLDAFPNVRQWFNRIKARPAVQRAVELGKDWNLERHNLTEEERKTIFGQDAKTVAATRGGS